MPLPGRGGVANLHPMPIYEYRCDRCDAAFEDLVFSDTVVACPGCRAQTVSRRLSVPAPPGHAAAAEPCGGPNPGGGCCGGGACQLN